LAPPSPLSVRAQRRPLALFAALVVVAALLHAVCVESAANPKKAAVAHLLCPVCGVMVQEAYNYVQNKSLVDEDDVADLVENLCSQKRKEGRWLTSLDVYREGGADSDAPLQVARRPEVGACRRECHLGRSACLEVLGGEEDQLKEMLRARALASDMRSSICKPRCKNRPLAKLTGWEDEEFKALSEAEVTSLEAVDNMPPGMQAYNAKDIMAMSESDQAAWYADQNRKAALRQAREQEDL